MASSLVNHDAALFDQAALVYMFKKQPSLMERVFFEHKWKYGFHVHYLSDMPIAQVGNWTMPLVLHYAGAQFCSYGDAQPSVRMESVFHFLTMFSVSLNQTCTLLNEPCEEFDPVTVYTRLQVGRFRYLPIFTPVQVTDPTLLPLPKKLVKLPNGLISWKGQGKGEGVF